MPEKDKTPYILRKRHLPVEQLAAQTGLSPEEVRAVLRGHGGGRAAPLSALKEREVPLLGFLLFLVVVLSYLPALRNDFVNWDDKGAILDNLPLRKMDGEFFHWILTTFETGNWMPLTWLSFALNYRMGGLDPVPFHATNILLHGLNGLWVFGIGLRLMRLLPGEGEGPSRTRAFAAPIAFLAALLFGLHPIHVESVAWATERKDVLYAFFYLWALFLYLGQGPGLGDKRRTAACLTLYLLSLMSKPMAVTLPFVFLVLDFWPLGRTAAGIGTLLKEKVPFWVLAMSSVLVTLLSHERTYSYARSGLEAYWVLNAFRSLLFYLVKMAFPVGLSAYYPFPNEITFPYLAQNLGAALLVGAASFWIYRRRHERPFLAAAGAYYALSLLPVLGFVQTGAQAAADRYTYLPSLAPFLLFATLLARWVSFERSRFGAAVLVLGLGSGWMTVGQIGTWHDTQTLWERVTKVFPEENADAYDRLGAAYLQSRRYDEALAAFSRAASIPPPEAHTFHGLGTALTLKDRVPEAIQAFDYALRLDPKMTGPRMNLWKIYERSGEHGKAVEQMKAALQVVPTDPQFHNNLGVSYTFLKDYAKADQAFQEAHRLDPRKADFLVNLATLRGWEGKPDEALALYRKAVREDPKEPLYLLKMGDLFLDQGKKREALVVLRQAWALDPKVPKVVQQIGEDLERLGQKDLAAACRDKLARMNGALPEDVGTMEVRTPSDAHSAGSAR